MTTLRTLLDRILDADLGLVVDRLAFAVSVFSLTIVAGLALIAVVVIGWCHWSARRTRRRRKTDMVDR